MLHYPQFGCSKCNKNTQDRLRKPSRRSLFYLIFQVTSSTIYEVILVMICDRQTQNWDVLRILVCRKCAIHDDLCSPVTLGRSSLHADADDDLDEWEIGDVEHKISIRSACVQRLSRSKGWIKVVNTGGGESLLRVSVQVTRKQMGRLFTQWTAY